MKNLSFPIFKTKSPKGSPEFDLANPKERASYFEFKAGAEIEKIQNFLKENTFVALLLGKKSSGKGTYSKLFAEAVGTDKIAHVSVGDVVREIDKEIKDTAGRKRLLSFLEANYRGFLPIEEIIKAQESRSTKKLLPTEFILALLKREIGRLSGKAVFIDGFPRGMDQISYSLFFRDLIGYRDDPDFFVLIDVPTRVIDERVKYRVVCPKCQTPRNLKLLITQKIGYDRQTGEFYLICDDPSCKGARMVAKEGDELGIGPIKKRLETDEALIEKAFSLHGTAKILLRNAIPVSKVKEYVDDYEVTSEYVFSWDRKKKKVEVKERPWIVKDDKGVPSCSLQAAPVVVSFIKQLADFLP